MSVKEDYLDNLLKTVSDEEPAKDSALGKLSDIQERDQDNVMQEDDIAALLDNLNFDEEKGSDADTIISAQNADDEPVEEMDFPELAKLFEEESTVEPEIPKQEIIADDAEMTIPSEEDVFAAALDGLNFDSLDELKEDKLPVQNDATVEAATSDQTIEAQGGLEGEDPDMARLLDSLSDNEDLTEISELLKQTDSNEIDDDMISLMQSLSESPQSSQDQEKTGTEVPEQEGPKRGRWSGRKKKNQEKDGEKKEKGPNIFQRLVSFLTEESGEDGSELKNERKQINLSDENIAILQEIDGEKPSKRKPKKEKKAKTKKEKKPKEEKKQKPPKPKKEKKPKPPKPPAKPERPLGKKRIMTVLFLGVTVFFGIQLFAVYLPENMQKQEAKKAFQQGDLRAAYDLLVTKKLNRNEEIMLKASTLYMEIDRKLDSYYNFRKMDEMELEALNALITGVEKYKGTIEAEAQNYGVSGQVKNVYLDILSVLQNEYGISEEEAVRLSVITDKVTYTKELKLALGQAIPTFDERGRLQY